MIEILKARGLFVNWLLFLFLLILFIIINIPFIVPLVLASIFALGMNDLIYRISDRTKIGRKTWIVIFIIGGFIGFWLPISLAIYRFVTSLSQPQTIEKDKILQQVQSLKEFVLNGAQRVSDLTGADLMTPMRDFAEGSLRKIGTILLNFSTELLGQLPQIVVSSVVFIATLSVLLWKAPRVKDWVLKYSPLNPEMTEPVIRIFKKSCSLTLFSTLVIGLIQATVVGIGSVIFGEGDFWLVITLTFFLSFIPVIGAAPVAFALAVLAYVGNRPGAAAGLVVVGLIAGSIDNILRPYMVGGEEDISVVVAFTSVVGAIIIMGIPGLLIGPVIVNLFVRISPLLLKVRDN
ncbi:AI-2E family transporter [Bdellovibrio bacteriovorus]